MCLWPRRRFRSSLSVVKQSLLFVTLANLVATCQPADPSSASSDSSATSPETSETTETAGESSWGEQPAECGNGRVDPGEECDDGNLDETDECTTLCASPSCVDGLLSGKETSVDCGANCPYCECVEDDECPSGMCWGNMCTDPCGWLTEFGSLGVDAASAVARGSDGGLYVAGSASGLFRSSDAGEGSWLFLSKVADTGIVEWTVTQSESVGSAIAVDSEGDIYVGGRTERGTSSAENDALVNKYDATGELIWTAALASDSAEEVLGLATDTLGNVYAVGYTFGVLGGESGPADGGGFVAKFSSTGERQWVRVSPNQFARGVALGEDQNVYVATQEHGSVGSVSALLLNYNSDGELRWETTVSEAGLASHGVAVAVDPVLGAYLTGDARHENETVDAFVAAFDPAGSQRWIRRIEAWDVSGLAVDEDGRLYVTGSRRRDATSDSGTDSEVFVARYEGDGNLAGERSFGTNWADRPGGIAVGDDIYVVGHGRFDPITVDGVMDPPGDVFVARVCQP